MKFLVTVQAYVDAESATHADNIAAETARYLEEANEMPTASPTVIQTAVAEKSRFRPLGPRFWAGASCEADILDEESAARL